MYIYIYMHMHTYTIIRLILTIRFGRRIADVCQPGQRADGSNIHIYR